MKKQFKRFVYIVLFFMFLVTSILGVFRPASASTTPVPLSSLTAGDTVNFAGYTWIVLDPSTGYLLMQGIYNNGYPFDVGNSQNFSGSSIEYLLNTTFYNSLPTADATLIQTHSWNVKDDNGNTVSGSLGSVNDYIGLLSCNDWMTYSKAYNTATGFLDNPPPGPPWPWTLTPDHWNISGVKHVSYSGYLIGDYANYSEAVRPALYLNSDILVSGGNGGNVLVLPITAIVAITGTPQVGSTLTAGALTPSGATASYHWQESATSGGTYTPISGATSDTYTPVAGDAGKYIKVVATGTGSYTSTVTSATAGPVTAPITAIATITGTPQVGSALTAGALTPSGATASYQWQESATSGGTYTAISGATSDTYTPGAADLGQYIEVVATGTGNYTGTATSAETGSVTAPITAIGAISGTPQVGSVLTAGALTPSVATASYQWQVSATSGGTYTDISGATSDTYTPVAGDAGKYIEVVATGTGSYTGTVTSTHTGPVNALTNAAVPTINNQPSNQTVNVGGTANLSIAASGGVALSYQWYSNTVNSTTGGAIISVATSSSYSAPTDAQGTKYYYCVVTNTDSGATGNQTATATSNVATVTVNALTNAAVPTINNQPSDQTVNVGGTANLSIAASGGVALSYQWYSNTVNSTTGGAIISGATSSSYSAPTDAQGTKYYYCVVTNTDSGASGNQTATATSNAVTVTAVPTHGGGGGGSSSGGGTTVTGSVIDSNGTQVSNVTVTVTTNSNGNYTVSMNAAQTVMLKQPDGTMSSLSDLTKVTFATAAGSPVTVSADGTINLTNLAKGTDNHFNITYDLGNRQSITIGTLDVTVSSSGAVSLTCTLIDPYGVIIDTATGKPIAGANVTLYYANTDRNKTDGKTPDTVVALPGIDGFKPNNNINPQLSDASGAYGFMVFPTTDYYLVATKEGYNNYTSPTISVEQDIVKWDFKMNQTSSGVTRLAGLNSVDTALAIAKANYTGTVANVILATADNYPDALAGSVLAYKLNAPVLLVGSSDADQEKVLAYMKSNLNPAGTVYILGGTAVVSSTMEGKVTAGGFANITRLGGVDRYETSVKIAEQLKVKTGTPIVLAYGENYPDALSISSIAAEMQYPILLVQKDGLSDAVKNEIAAIKPTKIYIIGGEGVISATVESQVAQITSLDKAKIVRIAGTDRYETSITVAQYFNLSGQSVCIATGNNFPDALAGSVYAANHNAPIILADGSLSDQAMNYLKGKKLTGATLFGGEAVVSKIIDQQLGQLMGK